eukprot:10396955-Ditylum_brightwellii.AAC.1
MSRQHRAALCWLRLLAAGGPRTCGAWWQPSRSCSSSSSSSSSGGGRVGGGLSDGTAARFYQEVSVVRAAEVKDDYRFSS